MKLLPTSQDQSPPQLRCRVRSKGETNYEQFYELVCQINPIDEVESTFRFAAKRTKTT